LNADDLRGNSGICWPCMAKAAPALAAVFKNSRRFTSNLKR
jgi:hypothetical protein